MKTSNFAPIPAPIVATNLYSIELSLRLPILEYLIASSQIALLRLIQPLEHKLSTLGTFIIPTRLLLAYSQLVVLS
jgi:hypothetical protein